MQLTKTLLLAATAATAIGAQAQFHYRSSARSQTTQTIQPIEISVADSIASDSMAMALYTDTVCSLTPLPDYFFLPAVYNYYDFPDSIHLQDYDFKSNEALRWLDDANALAERIKGMRHRFFFGYPQYTSYVASELPEAPKQYSAVVDPSDFKVSIIETVTGPADVPTVKAEEVKKRHWIRAFNVSLQFSQAYVSPNWYQGGNNNLNMLGQIYYNVKLNQEFHPNLLFETTAQYKLGMNNAPDDEIHSYNINEDVFQVNSTFGLKAAKRWYYSMSAQFKTQLLNSYQTNTTNLKSGFLSPGDLTVGVGMTYNYANKKKSFTFDANISPLSYNLRICTSDRLNHENYDIRQDRTTANKFGSNVELKLYWKMCYNIYLRSRMYAFSDYHTAQVDWENTIVFEINKFLTTQIFAHARYDTATPPVADSKWRKLQFKEILSIGFAYKFSSL
ncbi:MAG: DUF3078 domain-containing protein [Muribaculaceae bacterium]|nr:DUF3078 domain-containing protein [Muribaculaceae bacterium]